MARDLSRERYSMPDELPIAVLFAEGGGAQRSERWGHLSHRALDLIRVGETSGWDAQSEAVGERLTARAELEWVIAQVRNSPYPYDFSYGPTHLIWSNCPLFDRTWSLENAMACRAWLFDPANSLPMMLDRLQVYWNRTHDLLPSMFLYNAPGLGGQPASYNNDGGKAIRANYERGLASARAWLERNP